MTSKFRGLVSKNKRRFAEDGFDLDLSYITPQLIAMGFPSDGVEGLYRNPREEVAKFFNARHLNHYRVYNLCSERSYPSTVFHDNVVSYGLRDHHAPPFDLLVTCVQDMVAWLKKDQSNLCAVHCKAGKGRTGVVICCALLYMGIEPTPEAAMSFYGAKRTGDGKGVTIPSQRRFVHYFYRAFVAGQIFGLPERVLKIDSLTVSPAPITPKKAIRFKMETFDPCTGRTNLWYRHKDLVDSSEGRDLKITLDSNVFFRGNVDFVLKHSGSSQPFLHFWLNSSFLVGNDIYLSQSEVDGMHQDINNKRFHPGTKIHLQFSEMSPRDFGRSSDHTTDARHDSLVVPVAPPHDFFNYATTTITSSSSSSSSSSTFSL